MALDRVAKQLVEFTNLGSSMFSTLSSKPPNFAITHLVIRVVNLEIVNA